MSLFFVTFFVLYGGMHLYVFLKARTAFTFGTRTDMCLILFMALMVLAPVIVRLSEKHGFDLLARTFSYVGYTWLGILFLFFSASLTLDLYRFVVYISGLLLQRDLSSVIFSPRNSFFIPCIISVAIAAYGYFEARDIRTERILIKTSKLPPEVGKFTIAQISDVHLGLIVGEDRLKSALDEVRKAKPDILVSTGDLVDGQINGLNGLSTFFREINPRYGKFAVTGNHEFYAGLHDAIHFTEDAGFKVLRGEGLTLGGLINIAGVDDPTIKYYDPSKSFPEREVFVRLPRDKFTLFLKHRPLVDKNAVGLFDLQLSGHVHKGQIFPFSIATKLYYPVDAGFARLQGNSSLYVSRGTGTWGPPIRFLSPPEVTVIEIVSQ